MRSFKRRRKPVNPVVFKFYLATVQCQGRPHWFHYGESVKEPEAAFKNAVDDYLEACKKL